MNFKLGTRFNLIWIYFMFVILTLWIFAPKMLSGQDVCFKDQPNICAYQVGGKVRSADHSIDIITKPHYFLSMINDLDWYKRRGINVRVILNQNYKIPQEIYQMAKYSKTDLKGSSSKNIKPIIIVDSSYVVTPHLFTKIPKGTIYSKNISKFLLSGSRQAKPYIRYFNNEWNNAHYLLKNKSTFTSKMKIVIDKWSAFLFNSFTLYLFLSFIALSCIAFEFRRNFVYRPKYIVVDRFFDISVLCTIAIFMAYCICFIMLGIIISLLTLFVN